MVCSKVQCRLGERSQQLRPQNRAALLAAGLAYAAGYQSLARKLRKKFGGLRIY
jgi:hypothetical protein